MKKLLAPVTLLTALLGILLTGFLVSAHASSTVTPDEGGLMDLARPIFDEIMKGHYIAAAALALVLSVALVKRYAPGKIGDFVHSDPGGALASLLMAFGGALATATMGGAPWTWGILWTAATVAVTASGGYVLLKKLVIEPVLKPLSLKTPAWMAPVWGLVFWIFERKIEAAEKAKEAGDAAVKENPPTGITPPATDL